MEFLLKYIKKVEKEMLMRIPSDSTHQLFEPLTYILSNGGKRIRPALCLAACELYGGETKNALSTALAIEYFHNFSLLHDDIMDEAPLRRGNPTVHHKWNENQAILSGDALLVLSYQMLEDAPANNFKSIYQLFNKTAMEVCIGQQLDMEFETRDNVTEEEYLEMIKLKTSVLLAASLKIGSLCGNASLEESDKIYKFGINLGIAFQLRDDYLDVFGEAKSFGKQAGGDIIADKKTYLLIKAFEKASTEQLLILNKYQNNSSENEKKVELYTQIMAGLNIDEDVNTLINTYYQKALTHLQSLTISPNNKLAFSDFSAKLMDRLV